MYLSLSKHIPYLSLSWVRDHYLNVCLCFYFDIVVCLVGILCLAFKGTRWSMCSLLALSFILYCFECNSVSACLTVWLGFLFIGLNNIYHTFHACRMDEFFTLYVHHGEYFNENPKEYVRGDVGVIDDCDLDKWSKVVGCGTKCLEIMRVGCSTD